MNNNKHPHHDLIVEWAKDTSKQVQILNDDDTDFEYWCNCYNPSWHVHSEYRFKPREFIKGHWYPCFFSDNHFSVMVYSGKWFYSKSSFESVTYAESEFSKVGESLGEIKIK